MSKGQLKLASVYPQVAPNFFLNLFRQLFYVRHKQKKKNHLCKFTKTSGENKTKGKIMGHKFYICEDFLTNNVEFFCS